MSPRVPHPPKSPTEGLPSKRTAPAVGVGQALGAGLQTPPGEAQRRCRSPGPAGPAARASYAGNPTLPDHLTEGLPTHQHAPEDPCNPFSAPTTGASA